MKLRELTEDEVVFELHVEQDDLPVRGDAMSSDDAAFDKRCEDEILGRLDQGDIWAWAAVTITATWGGGFEGSSQLGCCGSVDEEDFKKDVYYEDMKHEALKALNGELARVLDLLKPLMEGLG